jgi:ribonuclease P protein component
MGPATKGSDASADRPTGSGASARASHALRPRGETSAPAYATLRKRAEFVAAARGAKFHVKAFSLQARRLDAPAHDAPARIGVTVTRKVGGAVERNRIRRRLREALRRAAPLAARPATDYVVIARREALDAPFERLIDELARAMRHLDGKLGRAASPPDPTAGGNS